MKDLSGLNRDELLLYFLKRARASEQGHLSACMHEVYRADFEYVRAYWRMRAADRRIRMAQVNAAIAREVGCGPHYAGSRWS